MCKKTLLGLTLVAALSIGGYYAFWKTQEEKLIVAFDAVTKSFEQQGIKISYKEIEKKGFPFKLGAEIERLEFYYPEKFDLRYNSGDTSSTTQSGEKSALKEADLIFDELYLESDIWLKDFKLKNRDEIKYKNSENSGFLKYDFDFDFGFIENPIQEKFLKTHSNLKNLKYIKLTDEGYKLFDMDQKLLEDYKGKSSLFVKNITDGGRAKYSVNIDLNHKNQMEGEIKNNKEKAKNQLMNPILKVDFDAVDESAGYASFDVKNILFKVRNSEVRANGKLTMGAFAMIPTGRLDVNFENYKSFFDLLRESSNSQENAESVDILEKTLLEIGEKKSDNSISVVYENGNGGMKIGNKDIKEIKERIKDMKDEIKDKFDRDFEDKLNDRSNIQENKD